MKWIDLPPVWLVLFLALAWAGRDLGPMPAFPVAGIGVATIGALLVVLAAFEFARARTTIIPHQKPATLITRGIFSQTRNPIYLADVLLLAGGSLYLGSSLGLILIPGFIYLITKRFILPEEEVLRATFLADFDVYTQQVKRWL